MIGVIVSIAQLLCSGAQSSYLGCDTLPLREGTAGIHGGIPPGEVALSADFPAGTGVWKIDETQPIAVIAGQPVNIDFRLPRAVMGSISARVVGPEGYRLDRFELSQSDQSMQALDGPVVRVDNLREGRYLLHALGSADGKQYAGFKQVDVSEGPVEVFIQLEAAGLINGRIIAEGVGVPLLDGSGISAWWLLDDDVVGAVRVDVSADGSFYFGNIFGERIFKVGLAKGWRVVSIRADGKDITDDVLHVAPGSRTQLTITVGRQ